MAAEFPRIYLLPTHLQSDELRRLQDVIPTLTQNVREADVVVGKISKRERALFELRRLRLETEEMHDGQGTGASSSVSGLGAVNVAKLSWLTDCLDKGSPLPVGDYLLYRGRKLPPKPCEIVAVKSTRQIVAKRKQPFGSTRPAFARTSQEVPGQAAEPQSIPSSSSDEEKHRHRESKRQRRSGDIQFSHPPHLVHETTSEHEERLPPIPAFLHTSYSCERPSPINPPNAAFIEELKDIRTLRLLQGDQIGVRAYSTAIAALAAYPHRLQRSQEITRLPGCSNRIAELFQQWQRTGRTNETMDAAKDPKLAVLRKFYGIWGVGETTAREFYNKGWRDLDDIVQYGWDSLSRVQQIGVKYYDELQLKIPRAEVEEIAGVVLSQARIIDPGFQMMIVGGYRRGKLENSDVDVVLSHKEESKTLHVIQKLVIALEEENFITHALSLGAQSSERGQAPSAWKGSGHRRAGSGFDTLDKALVVWQNPKGEASSETGTVLHRRVDIIISPWKTVGCAVLGWSGATTFERDLRRYCKVERGFRFDSSGIRSRADGSWVDLEGVDGPAQDMETAEKRVFAGIGLPWRTPTERCTG